MDYDQDKVDEMVLALLYLTSSRSEYGTRAWKGVDIKIFERLHQKGLIDKPDVKSPTVVLTEAGQTLSKELFFRQFGLKD